MGDDERRSEKKVIAGGAVDAALRGISENASFHRGGVNFFSDGLGWSERRAGGFFADEFDTEQEAESADFANVRMRLQRSERGAESFGGGSYAREEMVRFEVIENGVARSGCDGMGLIRETVLERAGAAFEGLDDARRNENGAERSITTGNSLPGTNEVRLEVPMLDGKGLVGAAYAGHDFVGDKKEAAIAADFGDASGVAFGGNGGAECCADNRFEDESGGGSGIVGGEKRFQIIGASNVALRKCFFEGTVIAETGSDVAPFGKQRLIRSAASDIAADGHRAERAAVITLAAGEDTVTSGLAFFEMELAGELDGRFDGFGAAGGEVNTAAILKIWWGEREKASRQLFRRARMKL